MARSARGHPAGRVPQNAPVDLLAAGCDILPVLGGRDTASGLRPGRYWASGVCVMDERRTVLVSAVGLAVVIPLLVIVYLAMRFGSGQLKAPGAVIVVFLLTLVLIWVGWRILCTPTDEEPDSDDGGLNLDHPSAYLKASRSPDDRVHRE